MKLPTDVVMSVRDLVNNMQPNTPDEYEQLKTRLTESYGKQNGSRLTHCSTCRRSATGGHPT